LIPLAKAIANMRGASADAVSGLPQKVLLTPLAGAIGHPTALLPDLNGMGSLDRLGPRAQRRPSTGSSRRTSLR